MSKRLTTNYCP